MSGEPVKPSPLWIQELQQKINAHASVEQGRQESALVSNGYIVSRDVEPSKLHVGFIGGMLVLEVKRDGWQEPA